MGHPGGSWPFSAAQGPASGVFWAARRNSVWGVKWERTWVWGCSPECLKLLLLVIQPFCDQVLGAGRGPAGSAPGLLPGSHRQAAHRSALLTGPPVFLQTMLTAISMSAIATNGVVPGKGCWRPGHLE